MNKILKIEFKKMLISKGFKMAMIIDLILVFCQAVNFYFNSYLGQKYNFDEAASGGKYNGLVYPTVMIQGWLGQDYASFFLNLFYMLFPIIAVIPYGSSLYHESSSGYLKNICISHTVYLLLN